MRIGQVAALSGIEAATIRFYEQQGLLPAAPRQANHYRDYSAQDVHRLRLIRLCRSMDMSLEEVKALLALDGASAQDCRAASDTVQAHLGHVRARIQELQELERTLAHLLAQCQGPQTACGLLAALHAQADAPHSMDAAAAPTKRHV